MGKKVRLEPHSRGGLLIWKHPEPGRAYFIASDTAGGSSGGDFAAACVIDGETRDVVAGWSERCDPHNWGPKCARLGWYFNEAILAFETHPSAHGLAAANAARDYGYGRMYFTRRQDSIKKTVQDTLGFHTHLGTKPLLINEIKQAVEAGVAIPWPELVLELKRRKWSEPGATGERRMIGPGNDDKVMAFGIALMVRKDCYQRGMVKTEVVAPRTDSERYWAAEDKRLAALKKRRHLPLRRRLPSCMI